MTTLVAPPEWFGPSDDPGDEQFADVVEPAALESAGRHLTVLLGEAVDSSPDGGPGARRYPTGFREALAEARTHHVDAGPVREVADLGTVEVPRETGDVAAIQDAIRDFAARVHRTDAVPVFLGGDGSLTYANAAPLLDGGSLGVVAFDARLRCRAVRGRPTSRTAFRQLFDAGLDSLAVVGARHFESPPESDEFLRSRDATIVTSNEVHTRPTAAVNEALDAVADVDTVYASLDLSVLDARAPTGLSPVDLFPMLTRLAADPRVAGFEVVGDGSHARGDADGRGVQTGGRAIAHFLAGLADGR